MGAIDIKDVQARIIEMLKAVEGGDTVAITRDGKAVATLEPANPNVSSNSTAELHGHSLADALAASPGHLAFQTPDDVDSYLREERDAWER